MLPSTSLLGYLKLGVVTEYLRGISSVSIARAPEIGNFPALVENDPARRYCVMAVVEALEFAEAILREFGMRKSLAVAEPLGPMVAEMKQALAESNLGRELILRDPFAQRLVDQTKALGAMIEVEIAERRTIDLDLEAATETIVNLAERRGASSFPLSPAEVRLWDDAVRALCTGAGRAAVLAAWECGWGLWRRWLASHDACAAALENKRLMLSGKSAAANPGQILSACSEIREADGVLPAAVREELTRLWEDRLLLVAEDAEPTPAVLRGYLERMAALCGRAELGK